MALAVGLLAGAMWFDPTRTWLSARSPIPLVGLTGRYLGAWCAFVSVTAATAFVRGRRSDVRIVGVLVGSISIGMLAATARTWGSVGTNASMYVVGLLGVGAVAATLLIEPARRRPLTSLTDLVARP